MWGQGSPCVDWESLPVALLVLSTSSSSHDREEMGSSEQFWGCVCEFGGGASASELVDGSQNMKQCRGNVWWVRCTELQAREQACWGNYSLMGSFGRQLPGVNVVWRDEVRLKWNFWLENVFKWKGSRQTSCALMGWEVDWGELDCSFLLPHWEVRGLTAHSDVHQGRQMHVSTQVHSFSDCIPLLSKRWCVSGQVCLSLLTYILSKSTKTITNQNKRIWKQSCFRMMQREMSFKRHLREQG